MNRRVQAKKQSAFDARPDPMVGGLSGVGVRSSALMLFNVDVAQISGL